MVKTVKQISTFLLAVVLLSNSGLASAPDSLHPIIGKNLISDVVKTLPHRDCSTPQNAFLGFLRSNAEGNLRDYLFYLTPQTRKEIAGVEDENAISDEKARDFEKAFKHAGFREFRLESFQVLSDLSSSPTQIVAVVSSSRGKMTGKEQYSISLVKTNGLWKFTTVDISPIDRKPTDK